MDMRFKSSLTCDWGKPTIVTPLVRARRYSSGMHNIDQSGRGPEQAISALLRRLTDVMIASAILTLISPLMIFVLVLMKLESAGPVLEKCPCTERGGRRFKILRFRTLMHDPDSKAPIWGRKTQVGQFLRYTRIEDLPQLINVIRGEMSLISRDDRSPSFLS